MSAKSESLPQKANFNTVAFKWLKLPFMSRLILGGFFYVVSVLVQIASRNFFLGLPFIVAAWIVLAQKMITNKPDDRGLEDWRAVETATVDKILKSVQTIRTKGKKHNSNIGCGIALLVVLGIVSLMFLLNDSPFSLVLADGILFFVPAVFAAAVRFFVPPELEKKFTTAVAMLGFDKPEGTILTPYIRFDKDKANNDIPEDIRFMLEKKNKPDDFIGVQFQIAINNGANGEVPYLYAVALTRGKGTTYTLLANKLERGQFIVEKSGEGEYGIIVVRQQTGGTGYHTTASDCEHLWKFISGIVASL